MILTTVLFSCSDETVMLYHPEEENPNPDPEKIWLLQHIDFPPDEELGIVVRDDATFSYTDGTWTLKSIDNSGGSFIKVDYRDKEVIFSMKNETTSAIRYDSLLLRINSNGYVESALHVTYNENTSEDGASKVQILNDSTSFIYDAQGYLKRLEGFNESGDEVPTYWENYTIDNENVKEISTSVGYKHIYTYDDLEHSISAGYCYEMRFNTISISQYGGCWLLTNLPYLSKYTGKRNKNNVIRTVIMQDADPTQVIQAGAEQAQYADISYSYTSDENSLVTKVKMAGYINGKDIPDDYNTVFSYLEKEVEKEEN